MNDTYYNILIKLASKASRRNEVPVSALIVKNSKIIAKSFNRREKTNSILDHAEVKVITKSSRKLHTWHLDDCDLYVTLKPCTMCESIIKQSRIKNVYYLLDKSNSKKEFCKTNFIKTNNCTQNDNYHTILKQFFQKKRDKIKHL